MWQKKWINEVNKLRMLNEASLQPLPTCLLDIHSEHLALI